MAKYIHKQAAIHALVNEANIHNNPIKRAYTRAVAIIEQITAEDVQPLNRGNWNNGHCSSCGEDIASRLDTWTNVQSFKFCPNCGARMDGEQ